MKIRTATHLKLLAAIVATSACVTTQAADVFFNMDADPAANGFLLCGSHKDSGLYWVSNGGNPSTGGYLPVADGNLFPPPGATCCAENLVAVFPDIDGGYPIKAFHLTCDVRAGNSANTDGRPADGFSISYAREGDQALVNATNLFAFGAAGGDDAATTTNLNGSGDLENGTKTGVAICFDAWQGNWLPDTGPGGTPGPDVEGIEIRVDDKTLRQVNMQADRNGGCYYPTNSTCGAAVCADPNTEQTGPWANDGGDPTLDGTRVGLCWARLEVELTTNKQVTVIWKGTTLVDHFQLTNYPNHKGRLVLMGRTGGNAQNAHFDNVHIVTTPAIEATFDRIAFGPNPNQFAFYISDNPPSVVTNISQVILDGGDVTSSVVLTKNGTQNTGTYTQGPLFVAGSKHTVSVTWRTSLGQTLSATGLQFTVPAYLAVPSSLAVSSVDTTKPGFFIRPFQTAAGNPNRNYWTDEQLEGLHGPNLIDFSSVSNATGNGEAAYNGVIDFDNGQSAGQFPNNYSWNMFGIPAPGQANENNSSMAISAYLYFPSS